MPWRSDGRSEGRCSAEAGGGAAAARRPAKGARGALPRWGILLCFCLEEVLKNRHGLLLKDQDGSIMSQSSFDRKYES